MNDQNVKLLPLADIRVDPELQSRAQISQEVVADYADGMRSGIIYPPCEVVFDGEVYWLWDGFHREAGTRRAELVELLCKIRPGTRRDALLLSAGANAAHGLRRSNADKRRAVLMLLKDAEWGQWSDREIGRRAGVSNRFVGNVRRELSVNGSQMPAERRVERSGTQYTITVPARPTPPKRDLRPIHPLGDDFDTPYGQGDEASAEPATGFRIREPAMLRAVKLIIDDEFAIFPDRIEEEMVYELFKHGIVEWMSRSGCPLELRLTRQGFDLAQEAGLQPCDVDSAEEWIASYQDMMELYDRNVAEASQADDANETPWYMDPSHPSYRSDAATAMRLIDRVPEPEPRHHTLIALVDALASLAPLAKEEYYTPEYILQVPRFVSGDIDLDPTSCPIANETVQARHIFTRADNALLQDWQQHDPRTVWQNFPYTGGVMADLVDHHLAWAAQSPTLEHMYNLTNASVSSDWWQSMCKFYSAVCFLKKRVAYRRPDGTIQEGNLYSQTLFYYGPSVDKFWRACAAHDLGYCTVLAGPIAERMAA